MQCARVHHDGLHALCIDFQSAETKGRHGAVDRRSLPQRFQALRRLLGDEFLPPARFTQLSQTPGARRWDRGWRSLKLAQCHHDGLHAPNNSARHSEIGSSSCEKRTNRTFTYASVLASADCKSHDAWRGSFAMAPVGESNNENELLGRICPLRTWGRKSSPRPTEMEWFCEIEPVIPSIIHLLSSSNSNAAEDGSAALCLDVAIGPCKTA